MNRPSLVATWSLWILHGWLLGALLSFTIGSTPVCAADVRSSAVANFPGKITLQDERLTARIVATPRRQVLEEVGRLSGARIRWMGHGGEEPVSVEFLDLPLSEALRRILGEKNFLLFYTSTEQGTKLTQIWISSSGEEQPMFTRQGGKAASEDLGKFASTPLEMIPPAVPNDEDPSSRLETVELLATRAGEDPRARAALAHIAHHDSDPHVQETASAMLEGIE